MLYYQWTFQITGLLLVTISDIYSNFQSVTMGICGKKEHIFKLPKRNPSWITWGFVPLINTSLPASRVVVMNIWNTTPLSYGNTEQAKKPHLRFKACSFGHLSSQRPISTLPLSSYWRLSWMRQMLFAGLFICQWAWHRNNYLSLWSITWLLTRDAQDVWRAQPGPVL